MMERTAAAHTHITEMSGLEEAFRCAVSLTKKKGGFSIAAPGFSENELLAFERMCAENDLHLLREDFRDLTGRISTGFTMGDWGIAETGTLVLDSTSEDLRKCRRKCSSESWTTPKPQEPCISCPNVRAVSCNCGVEWKKEGPGSR